MRYAQHNDDISKGLIPCELANLVIGATLYLGDPRRTPVRISKCDPNTASFSVTICDFEDRGAEWNLPLWDISKFLVVPGSPCLAQSEQRVLAKNSAAMNRCFHIPADETLLEKSQSDIAQLKIEIDDWLHRNCVGLPEHPEVLLENKVPDEQWSTALEKIMEYKDLAQMDRDFAMNFASNPSAGEVVKGHRIVLADLGLCPYKGHVLRDPRTFEGDWSKPRRRRHILTRLAFMRVLLSRLRLPEVPLYRTIYSNDTLDEPRNTSFVSATLSQDVAMAMLEAGKKTRVAAMYWQQVAPDRLFMSFLETPALSSRYQEAEAVLLFSPSEPAF